MRSKMQLVEEVERPYNKFPKLKTTNYVNKTIPSLVNNKGLWINKHEHCLMEAKNFYKDLYLKKRCNRKCWLNKKNPYLDIPKLKYVLIQN